MLFNIIRTYNTIINKYNSMSCKIQIIKSFILTYSIHTFAPRSMILLNYFSSHDKFDCLEKLNVVRVSFFSEYFFLFLVLILINSLLIKTIQVLWPRKALGRMFLCAIYYFSDVHLHYSLNLFDLQFDSSSLNGRGGQLSKIHASPKIEMFI